MTERQINGQHSTAWYAVWDTLQEHNPQFVEETAQGKQEITGLECVLAEIRRLQSIELQLTVVREVISPPAGVPPGGDTLRYVLLTGEQT